MKVIIISDLLGEPLEMVSPRSTESIVGITFHVDVAHKVRSLFEAEELVKRHEKKAES